MITKNYPLSWGSWISYSDNFYSHYGESTARLNTGYANGVASRRGKAILKFDTSQDTGSDGSILSTRLYFYVSSITGDALKGTAYDIYKSVATPAAWMIYDTDHYWDEPGCSGPGTDRSESNMGWESDNLIVGWNHISIYIPHYLTFRANGLGGILIESSLSGIDEDSRVYIDLVTNLPYLQIKYRRRGSINIY